jgi:hypothetical protein
VSNVELDERFQIFGGIARHVLDPEQQIRDECEGQGGQQQFPATVR